MVYEQSFSVAMSTINLTNMISHYGIYRYLISEVNCRLLLPLDIRHSFIKHKKMISSFAAGFLRVGIRFSSQSVYTMTMSEVP